jgi:glutathione S-transferase
VHRLLTIRFSHFNEKARWALDRFGVPYEEEGYMPGLHAIGALRIAPRHGVGSSDRISTPLAMPILVTDDGRCIRDSSRIVRYVSDRYAPAGQGLYPDPEVATLEERFSKRLGPHTRRYAYFHAFQMPGVLDSIADSNVGPRQARWFKRLYPFIERIIARRIQVTPERAERSLQVIREEMAEVSRRIAGRRYLVGDRFTAADLAFASMASPGLLPEEGYGAVMPRLGTLPEALQALIRELRATPAGELALRMFREERGARRIPFGR